MTHDSLKCTQPNHKVCKHLQKIVDRRQTSVFAVMDDSWSEQGILVLTDAEANELLGQLPQGWFLEQF